MNKTERRRLSLASDLVHRLEQGLRELHVDAAMETRLIGGDGVGKMTEEFLDHFFREAIRVMERTASSLDMMQLALDAPELLGGDIKEA